MITLDIIRSQDRSAIRSSDESRFVPLAGLVAQVVPADKLMDAALETASKIASQSRPIVVLAKESVNAAYNTTLQVLSIVL